MPRTVKEVENYVRLLDGGGNALSSTGGVLDIGFAGDVTSATHDTFNVNANLQVNDTDLVLGQSTKVLSLPVTLAIDEDTLDVSDSTAQSTLSSIDGKIVNCDTANVTITTQPSVGSHANASSGQLTVGANEPSSSVDCAGVTKLSVFGSVDQACEIKLQQSQNDSDWYSAGFSYFAVGAEDFFMQMPDAGARYYRVVYDTVGTTATCTIAGKA